ncbi:bifunctional acetate--CoA ligase family protein/GNAT family N-acetyltransferase [Methylotetracoccus oryzae]|uniref:bifunctional acetate--CoA ligase family protein/GNAT family N-acetyltransferase n=1 Tax=Methylotetracoccus oryzae TaxID=1919059 RepID=UPI00111828EF|nr:bifunctional acetate--CoA ligase family protein/GNAT family N-acetyltransferase [Methylotetracoccus oryzae]
MSRHYLEPLFAPRSIAVFGASERADAVGTRLYANLLDGGFGGPIFAINPKYSEVRGLPCAPSMEALGQDVDLAVIATPASTVVQILRACGERHVRAAVVLSAGFGEHDAAGKRLEQAVVEECRRAGIRLLGPNCLGFIRPSARLNATFSNNVAEPGSIALISQSGAICTAILDWAGAHGIGFSLIVSIGDAADVGFGEVLDYLTLDPKTRSILMYVEGVTNARPFLSGLRAAARLKPVIVIKSGRHAEGSRAAMTHTGALVGADDVFAAALERAGVVRAATIEQLFAAAQLLSSPPRIRGDRLAIVTNAGGPGVMATDWAIDKGLELAVLGPDTLNALNQQLPENWSRANPVDILGDASPERYRTAVETCAADPAVDGLLVMLTPQAMSQPAEAAEAVIAAASRTDKPLLACWLGERQVQAGRALFRAARIPDFVNPETAIEAFGYLVEYRRNQRLLMQVPGPLAELERPDLAGAQLIIDGALGSRQALLTPLETRAVLGAFHIPAGAAIDAGSPNEALAAAECLGFPVALKIRSPDIVHKSDVDGVRLNIDSAASIRHAYSDMLARVQELRPEATLLGVTVERMYQRTSGRELFVGVVQDPVFGPVISFGAGGTAIEVLRDRAIALPPLNEDLARNLIAKTRISRLLGQFRNLPPINLDALIRVLLRISEMVCELPQIEELDINPLVADEDGVRALDTRIMVRPPIAGRRHFDHMAIHPYPSNWISRFQLPEGQDITIRPIRPEDAAIERAFVRKLSPEARYLRFNQALRELSQELLVRFTQLDYHRELALIATTTVAGEETEIAVARFFPNPDARSAEFAVVIADDWQRHGLGTRLMNQLIAAGREKGFETLEGEVLARNTAMLRFTEKLGFRACEKEDDPDVLRVTRVL